MQSLPKRFSGHEYDKNDLLATKCSGKIYLIDLLTK
jgi:hypothetical protein